MEMKSGKESIEIKKSQTWKLKNGVSNANAQNRMNEINMNVNEISFTFV